MRERRPCRLSWALIPECTLHVSLHVFTCVKERQVFSHSDKSQIFGASSDDVGLLTPTLTRGFPLSCLFLSWHTILQVFVKVFGE